MTEKEKIEEMAKVLCLFCKEMTEEKECERGKECYDWRLKEASFYYEQGYRKIPEGSVVLSKEEYLNDFNNQFNKGYKHGSKETAKEFFTELFKQYSVFNDNDVIIAWQVKEALKEFAKKHGVEVEE